MFVYDIVDGFTSLEDGEHKSPFPEERRDFGADLRVTCHVKEKLVIKNHLERSRCNGPFW
jgi:hypothetical protein